MSPLRRAYNVFPFAVFTCLPLANLISICLTWARANFMYITWGRDRLQELHQEQLLGPLEGRRQSPP